MSVDRIYLQRAARDIKESPEYLPYSKVRIIVGEDDSGAQLVYEAGDDSFRTLEITNPYGTQAIANSILDKIQGYFYKPYTADGAILNPAAELGDAVNVGEVYSFIASMDTTFSPLMSATISAPEDSNIDHEYPYESSESKEISRKINGAKASFIVEIGRIEASLEDYQRKEDMDGYVLEKYAEKGEDGSPKMEAEGQYIIAKGKITEFREERQQLNGVEVEITKRKLKKLPDAITPAVLEALMLAFEFPEEEVKDGA